MKGSFDCGNSSCDHTITHFPVLRKENPTDTKKYMEEMQLLQQELNYHFQDICKYEATITVFSVSFDVNVEIVPAEF
jgi:hypothetical protein